MKIREIPLDDLVLDPNLNLRDRLDDFTVERYADSWDRLPPITVYNVDDRLAGRRRLPPPCRRRHAGQADDPGRDHRGNVHRRPRFRRQRQPVPRPAADPRRTPPGGRGQAQAASRLVRSPHGRRAGRQPRAGRQDPPAVDRVAPDPQPARPRRRRRQALHLGRPSQGRQRAASQGVSRRPGRRVDRARAPRHGHRDGSSQGRSARRARHPRAPPTRAPVPRGAPRPRRSRRFPPRSAPPPSTRCST